MICGAQDLKGWDWEGRTPLRMPRWEVGVGFLQVGCIYLFPERLVYKFLGWERRHSGPWAFGWIVPIHIHVRKAKPCLGSWNISPLDLQDPTSASLTCTNSKPRSFRLSHAVLCCIVPRHGNQSAPHCSDNLLLQHSLGWAHHSFAPQYSFLLPLWTWIPFQPFCA